MSSALLEPVRYTGRDGQALETISDDIDALNVLKSEMRRERGMHELSVFDAEKDKA